MYLEIETYWFRDWKQDWHIRWPHVMSWTGSDNINEQIKQMNCLSRIFLFWASIPTIWQFNLKTRQSDYVYYNGM